MRSYRFARRAFLAAAGGAIGLKVLLRNLEAVAEGASSPSRFLLTHFPCGTLRHRFLPSGSGATYVTSPIIRPFEEAGLRDAMTVFYGFSDGHLRCPGGGGEEAGTVFTTTCCSSPGTRANGGEADDAVAGGPSFDQVFLRNVPELQTSQGFVNAICDARVDSNEVSTRCLSYDYATREIESTVSGALITEHEPLLPELSPARIYSRLFATFIAGGATPGNQAQVLKALAMRKSVLDFALTELKALEALAPRSEAVKIERHTSAIRTIERQLSAQIQGGRSTMCQTVEQPDAGLVGKEGNDRYLTNTAEDDTAIHRAVAEAHLGIILAAFQCDLIRVATFQFSPGTNHVAFKGMWPSDPNRSAMHHPATHRAIFATLATGDPAELSGENRDAYEFLCNVQTWYNQRLADALLRFKAAEDGFGGKVLDFTVIPFVTEITGPDTARSPKPAFLFGGNALGLRHGTFHNFSESPRPQVDLYLTCAQALMRTADPHAALTSERFIQDNPRAAPIPGLWLA